MTIESDVAASGPYYPDGIATVFPFEFEVASASDLKAVWLSLDGTETPISSASYSVEISDTDPGGEVTFAIAPTIGTTGDELWLYLDPVFEQQDRYSDEGPFNQSLLGRTADKAVRLSIALKEKVDRALLLPRGTAGGSLPRTALEGRFITWDADGRPILSSGSGADGALRVDLADGPGAGLVGSLAGGVGAIARSIADWFADQNSVMSYLSLADRVKIRLRTTTAADANVHRLAIQRAMDAGKGVVDLPAGLYWTNPDVPLSPKSDQIIRGRGAGTEIRAIGTINNLYNIFRVADVSNVALEDFMVVGDKGIHASAGTGYVTGDTVSLTEAAGPGAGMRGTVTAYNGRIQRIDIDPANPGNGLYTHNGLVNVAALTGAGTAATWRVINRSVKTWLKGTSYDALDSYVKPGDGKAYMTAVSHVAGVFADDLAAGKWVLVNPAGETVQAPYDGESGMGIGIYQSINVAVRRVIAKECWGDGIYVGGNGAGQCDTVLIEDCDCDGNRRQGCTIASAKNWKIVRGDFRRQGGTLPASGIDIEPNTNPGDGDVENGEIVGARCYDNYGAGLTCALSKTMKLRVIGVDSWGNGHSGGYFAGLGDGLELEGGNWFENTQHGLMFAGTSTMSMINARIIRPRVVDNLLDGIVVRYNVRSLRLVEPIVHGNMQHGIRFEGYSLSVTDCALIGGDIRENGQEAHNGFSNVWIGESTPFLRIRNVTIRRGLKANQPAYGIRIRNNETVTIEDNDLYVSGNVANVGCEVPAADLGTTAGALPSVKLRNNEFFKTEGRWFVDNVAVDVAGYFSVNIPINLGYLPKATDFVVSVVDPSGSAAAVNVNIRNGSLTKTNLNVRMNVASPAAAGIKYSVIADARRPSVQ